ncbi:hypothetical protein QNO07_11725 [Streptomyces sp. 549]|uniref:hypothetical protein n=1 Tax=Streptomyces sp. 549 TaxID=3049076 RepID=UPI0024C378F2|nr:hypothetical protein [Streptomyces sp. 549]MDK1474076.1 hypothetical protein [Streptomyces sp. 549]
MSSPAAVPLRDRAPQPVPRAPRAVLFAAVCTALAASGHAVTSGHTPALPVLLAAFAATAAAAWLGCARRRGAPAIGGGLLTAQAALHWLFSVAAPTAHPAHTAGADPTGHAHHAPTPLSAVPAEGDGVGMLAAHLFAALLCALWLWHGETVLFRLLGALRALALPPLAMQPRPAPLPTAPRLPPPHLTGPHPRAVLTTHTLSRRGPPA